MSTRPALERLQAIDLAVSRLEWPNARTLARELEVTRRTIQRDIAFMHRLHAPLEFDSVRNGYYYTDPSYRLGYWTKRLRRGMGGAGWVGCADWEEAGRREILV